ncbi:hypothetical protein ENSA5_59660 [Enhygromyxa salina]|uniref:Uncharacterized protein n=1 Tax=Enhygromyxa salina TaxID=215803 RepID=A0A2S9XDX7_9BACT|nr:hypothetical protein [Enhygromyxa salina]PRP90891.1 hypothetical protein ENSA5_59660 [Enhygromyxa salina]
MPAHSSLLRATLISASLMLAPLPSLAAPEPAETADAPSLVGPERPPLDATSEPPPASDSDSDEPEPTPAAEPEVPLPSVDPSADAEPGIEFAVPLEAEPESVAKPEPERRPTFPDPGIAPTDGASILTLSVTTIALTLGGLSAGLVVGLNRQTPLEWLLPTTIVPTVGLLAFSGGGLYLGIQRARAYRRWEIGYRVIGKPQGGGLMIGGAFGLLAAIGFIPSGAFAFQSGQVELGATLIAIGSAAAVATPIMYGVGLRRQREHQRTGGWKRKPVPPLPPGVSGARLQLTPIVAPLPGGLSLGAAGRF